MPAIIFLFLSGCFLGAGLICRTTEGKKGARFAFVMAGIFAVIGLVALSN
jgi:hypothetical protein